MESIDWDSSLEKSEIDIEVEDDGVVTLKGRAPNYRSRRQAMNRIYDIRGVKKINNKIKVEFTGELDEISDEEVAENIRSTLKSNSDIRSDAIDISVNNGSVMIEGTVDSFWKKDKVIDLITDIHGVIGYIDKVVVVPAQKKEDKEIAKAISSTIARNQRLAVPNVDIAVNNGIVYLNGKIANFPAYETLEEIVKYTKGVKGVKNNLELID
jgi:osmotically-inducible protein OsmY